MKRLKYWRKSLQNGLRVILAPVGNLHSVSIAVYCRSGPRFEPVGKNGITHFVEHLLFRGTERYPNSATLSAAADSVGADLNGATFPEYTEITLNIHHRHLTAGMEIMGDLICRPRFDAEVFPRETRVVLEELAQQRDGDGSPVNLDELAHRQMWPRQRFSFSSIGRPSVLRSLGRLDVLQHYRRMFCPQNVVLTMAGAFDVQNAMRLVRRHFSNLPDGTAFRVPPIVDRQRHPRLTFRRHTSPVVHIRLCHKACSYQDPNLVHMLLLCDILGGGISSRLFRSLRDELGLVYDVGANPVMFSDAGALEIATSTTRARAPLTVKALLAELNRLLSEGIPDEELRTVKRRAANHLELMLDSPPDLVEWFGVRELLLAPRRPPTPHDQLEKVLSTTADDLMRMARKVFRPERRNLLVVGALNDAQRERIRDAFQSAQ